MGRAEWRKHVYGETATGSAQTIYPVILVLAYVI